MPASSTACMTDSESRTRSPGLPTTWRSVLPPAIAASLPSDTFWATVSESNSSMRWKVRPNPRLARAAGPRCETSSSCSKTVPRLGRTSPLHALKVVVLPAPFGPISPVIRLVGARRLRPWTAAMPP